MTYEPKMNTLYVGENSDFLADSGIQFVYMLKEDALGPRSTRALVKDWETITTWLKCPSGEFTDEHHKKISNAWKAYYAIGMAPSFVLQEIFDDSRDQYKSAGFEISANKALTEIMDVFDRMLASDEEIAKKKKFDYEVEKKKFETVLEKPLTSNSAKKRLHSITRRWRIIISGSIGWIIWAVFRTAGDYEVLGFYLERWDEDMFFVNAFAPILLGIIGLKVYKWVMSART
jgi:hypothetical protein